ncbi:Telomerase reverse transcriptase, partial [Conglomerata obtusa]
MAIYFYMTELSFCGLKIFYFKKNTWITEASKYIKSFITQFETLNKEVIRSRSEKVACYEEKQFPLIRLIPKEIGFRPVVNLSQRDKNLLSKNLENKLLQKILEHKTKNPLNESKNNRFLLAKELCKYRKEQNKSFIY